MRRHRVLGLFIVCLSLSSGQALRAGDPVRVSTPPSSIKILMLSNVTDPVLGQGFAANEAFISSLLQNQAGTKGVITKLRTASQLTQSNILQTINSLAVGQNDTLICYVSTHGGFDENGDGDPNSHFFGFPNGTMKRTTLFNALHAQNARLTILISDSCFSSVNPSQNLAAPAFTAVEQTNALYYLLRYYQGEVDINGASPFHYGIYVKQDGSGGGVFSRAFWRRSLYANPNDNWSDFFSDLVGATKAEFHSDFPTGVTIDEPPGFVSSQQPYRFPH
jgi:hypothetical protein